MKNLPAIIILIFVHFLKVYPQTHEFHHEWLDKDDPGSSDFASCLLHDSKGFMWFGERSGLKRYDGYSFKSYYHNGLDTTSLSDNCIFSMCEDNDGNIWMGSISGGLIRYNRAMDDFTRYPRSRDDPYNLRNATIWAICKLKSGIIWFSAHSILSHGVYTMDPRSGNIKPVVHDTVRSGNINTIHTRCIYEDRNGIIWTGDGKGLHKYDSASGLFIHYRNDMSNLHSLSCDTVISIYEDRSGTIWIGTYNGLNQFDRDTNLFIRYFHEAGNPNSLNGNYIGAVTEDNEGNLIIKTSKGINFLNKLTGSLVFWNYFDPYSSPEEAIKYINYAIYRSLYLDTCGILWFATYGGFNKLILKRKQFTFLLCPHLNPPAGICQDNTGDLWIGTWGGGIYRVITNRSANTLEKLRTIKSYEITSNSEVIHYLYNVKDTNSLNSDVIISLCQDREGTMWIGSGRDGILYSLDSSGKRERFIPYAQGASSEVEMWQLTQVYEDRNGLLWIGRDAGLEIFDRVNKKFVQYDLDPEKHEFQNVPYINAICEGDSGCIWVGTWFQGLFKIIPPIIISPSGTARGKRTVSYKFDSELPGDLGYNPIVSLCVPRVQKTAKLWIGTDGGGLFGLIENETSRNGYSERFIHYTIADGLPCDIIWGILDDDRGNLWISTQNGFSKFNPQSGEFNNYNEYDGVADQQFIWISSHKGRNGELYFGANKGLLAFHPDSITDNPFIPPVVITDFKLFNKPVPIGGDYPLKKAIDVTTELELSYRENYLSFEFAALNYINIEKNRYKYMMEGLDMDWIDAGKARTATYSSLKHGEYTFKVIGSNNDGVWNEEGASINIFIHPPPWLTWWAYICYGLILIGIILWYRRYLLNRAKLRTAVEIERMEKEKVRELDHMKSRFFANISHEFRTPLTLILGPIDDLFERKPKRAELTWDIMGIIRQNARRLQKLINQILDISRLETGEVKLQVSEGDLNEFIRAIILSFISLAESKQIRYEYNLPEKSENLWFDNDKVEKILTNLISNAFKFTPANGKINVSLQYLSLPESESSQLVEIKVSDTGKGIPKEHLDSIFDRFYQVSDSDTPVEGGTGIGLALTKELVDLYRGEIIVESEVNRGTIFTVKLPVSKDLFREEEIIIITSEDILREKVDESDVDIEETENIETGESYTKKALKDAPVVLIVEDNIDLRNYISRSLGSSYQVMVAENGREGLKNAIDYIPDLVISDLMMPEMDGMDMCRQLKTDERTNHIPVIMLTARADRGSKLEGLETGADDYIIKPFDAKELKVRVRNLVEQRKSMRDKFRKEFISDQVNVEIAYEDQFMNNLTVILNKHISDPDFRIDVLEDELHMSRSQVFRKISAITGYTPIDLIRNLRLKKAASLFRSGHIHVAQVMHQVGFNSQSYFGKCFNELYGMTPTEYIHSKGHPHLT